MVFVQKKGYFYINTDSTDNYLEEYNKSWFCVSQIKYNNELNNIEKMAKIWRNKIIHSCGYNKIIENEIYNMEKRIYSRTANFIH